MKINGLGTRGTRGGLTIRRGSDWNVEGMTTHRLSVRAVDDNTAVVGGNNGGFEGWGCVFGVRDSYGTTFQPGCFGRGGLEETEYPLLWMHSGMVPIGTFRAEEREEGLWIAGTYDPTPEGQAARARALSGSAPELSVGFVWLDDGGEDGEDLITSARLVETSQITLRMAAVPGSGFQGVRGLEDADQALDDTAAAAERARALLDLARVL